MIIVIRFRLEVKVDSPLLPSSPRLGAGVLGPLRRGDEGLGVGDPQLQPAAGQLARAQGPVGDNLKIVQF